MTSDHWIQEFLNDPRCDAFEDGLIQNSLGRKFLGHLKSDYYYVKYKSKYLSVARIICFKFNGKPFDNTYQVNHKDGNKEHNCFSNLEWVTQSENMRHRYDTLGYVGIKGRKKINEEIAEDIRRLRKEGFKYSDLMEKFDLCKSTISYIVNNKTWQ